MPISQIIFIVIFAIVVLGIGARLDMKNREKEKAARKIPKDSGR